MSKFGVRLLVSIWTFFFFEARCQISQTSGPVNLCAPANVTFTAPAGATNISWNFGSFGSPTSASGNFNVTSPASFNAVFSGMVGGSPVTFTVPVAVHAKPVANFSLQQPSNSCVVKTVTLTDQSTSGSTIASWLWTYGDGGSGNNSGTHTYGYTLQGTFSVTLKVIDQYGCENQITKGPVNVTAPPTAVLSSNPQFLSSCASSLVAAFSASSSSGPGTLSYNWNFGNGQTSQAVSPGNITFTAQSSPYVITLTVTSNGCHAYAQTFATVSPPTLSVTVPATVCMGAAPVATIFSNQGATSWSMGNSFSTSVATPPVSAPTVALPSYTTSGNFTITVTAGAGSCSLAPQNFPISVDHVSASFTTAPPVDLCSPSTVVTYSDQSTGNIVKYHWSYFNHLGVQVFDSVANPAFTLFATPPADEYDRTLQAFSPLVKLVVTSAAGCRDSVSLSPHTITRPIAWFYKDKREGCAPLTVTFYDSSLTASVHPITSYTWSDGAPTPSLVSGTTIPIPPNVFTYTAAGIYRPYLIVETSAGCIDTSFIDTVIVETPPAVSFSFFPAQVCIGQTVQIVNTTPNAGNIQHWHAESDNGFFSGCVSDANPAWKFTNAGVHTFTLLGYKNGCLGQAVSSQSVIVTGPGVNARFETNCTSQKSVNYYATLQEAQTATISFGDNTYSVVAGNATGIVTQTASHTYSVTGDYTVVVIAVNALTGCAPATFTMAVQVREAVADFTAPAMACAGSAPAFDATPSIDVFASCGRGYTWYIDNLPPIDQSGPLISTSFSGMGTHSVTLVVRDVNGCQDKLTKTIAVSDVVPTFTMNSSTICFSNPTLQITNTTQHVPDSIVKFFWSFGNGDTLTTAQHAVPTLTYNLQPGTYPVVLTATNSKGCVKSVQHNVAIINPNAGFTSSSYGMCLPPNTSTVISFMAQQSYPTYTFDFGVSPTSTAIANFSVTSYTFPAGTYTVTMKITDAQGCVNSGSLVIQNQEIPQADFAFSSPGSTGGNSICSPAVVSFTNVSAPGPSTPVWNMGTGQPVLPLNVVTFPYSSSTTSAIAISLSVTGGAPYYCKSEITKHFTIYVASADIVVSKTLVCLGDEIRFSIDSSSGGGVKAWVWDYGDATSTSSIQAASSPPSFTMHAYKNYTATAAGNTTASLIYWSSGDACKYSADVPIRIINVQPGFSRNDEIAVTDSMHCVQIPDRFRSTSVTNSQNDLQYAWKFPDGFTSGDSVLNYTFPTPGVKQVTLTVSDAGHNCVETTIKGMTIHALPSASVAVGEHCPDRPFTLTVSLSPGVRTGTWNPAAGIIGPNAFTATSSLVYTEGIASATTIYSLSVTDSNACVSPVVNQEIRIVPPAPRVDWDTAVVVGEKIHINADLGNYTYTWTPDSSSLSCGICPNPVSSTTADITYTVIVEDHMKCSQVPNTYRIRILPLSSVDVPTAFTPNGDGRNDVIYVDGWGIRILNYFRIYNRWGQLIFESNDIDVGWDGNFNGVPQNTDTYVYEVSVQSYIDEKPLTKTATFKLLR